MKKTPWIIGIIVVLLLLGGWWFWSLGKVTVAEDTPAFILTMQSPSVEVKAASASTWVPMTDKSVDVHAGDQIKTGPAGKAEIHWGERGVTRLEANTELTVESMPDEDHYMTNASIQLRVSTGRVWTRVLKLLDMNSQVTVRTDDVVATVRGTSFGVVASAEGSDVLVSQSSVAVIPTGKDRRLLSQNEMGTFQKKGTIGRRTITDTDTWVQDQKKADEKYDNWLRGKMKERLKKFEASNTRDLSERVHARLGSGDGQARLQEFMLHRAMLQSRQGNHALPSREMLRRLPPKARERVLANVEALLFVNPDAPDNWKKQMEAMRGEVIEIEGGRLQRLEEIPVLEPLPFDVQPTSTSPTATTTPLLPLKPGIMKPSDSVITNPTKPAPLSPTRPVTDPVAPTPPPAPSIQLSLIASPAVGTADQPLMLTVYKVVDGVKTDVTSSATISFTPDNATLQGRTFTPGDVGTYSLTAVFSDPVAGRLTSSIDLKVGPAFDPGPAASSTFGVQ